MDGFAEGEARKEGGALDAGEGGFRPVEHFLQAEVAELLRISELVEERAQHGQAEVVGGRAPLEAIARLGVAFIPQHPRGEDAVEERLDERGAEEVFAFLARETDAERGSERFANRRESIARRGFDAGAGFAGGEARGVEQDAAEIFGQALAEQREVARMAGEFPKGGFAFGNNRCSTDE